MKFQPGREKTGGRKPGTRNRRTTEIQEFLAETGCDPFEVMATIATDGANEPSLRLQAAKELAQYVAPKLRSIERIEPVNGEDQEMSPEDKKLLLEVAHRSNAFFEREEKRKQKLRDEQKTTELKKPSIEE